VKHTFDDIIIKTLILSSMIGLIINSLMFNIVEINIFLLILILSSIIGYSFRNDTFHSFIGIEFHHKYLAIICLNLIFIMIFIISTISLTRVYSRSTWFLIAVSLMSLLIFIETLVIDNKIKYIHNFVLLKIILIGILIRGSLYYQYPSPTADAFYHMEFIDKILDTGYVPTKFGLYSSFPMLHIFVTIISEITSIGLKSSFFYISAIESIGLVFVYLIVDRLYNNRAISLLSVLILEISTINIYFSYFYLGGGTFTFIFFLLALYLVLLLNSKNGHLYRFLFVLVILTIVLSHTQTPFVLLIVLITFYITSLIFNLVSKYHFPAVSYTTIMYTALVMLSYWIYASKFFESYILLEFLNFGLKGLPSISHIATGNTLEVIWTLSPIYVLEFFGLIGFLYVLRNIRDMDNKIKKDRVVIILGVLVCLSIITGIAYVSQLTSLAYIRWLYYVEVFVSSFVAIGVLRFSSVSGKMNIFIASVLFIVVSSIFIMSPYANNNDDVVPWVNEYTRDSFTSSELSAIYFTEQIRMHTSSQIFVDTLTYRAMTSFAPPPHYQPEYPYRVAGSIITGEMKNFEGFLLLRTEAIDNLVVVSTYKDDHKSISKVRMNFAWYTELRREINSSLIYDNPQSIVLFKL